jgi:outer membrane protein assembly factor BamD (BamD/ComL family)
MRRTLFLLSSFLLLAACRTAPPAPPDELAKTLLTEIDAGRAKEARELFERVADDEEYRDKIYPVVYGAARTRYQEGNAAGAATLLRFLHGAYPSAASVREALLYALFLERAGAKDSDPELAAEIDELLADLRAAEAPLPAWIDLIEAQQAIDGRDPVRARDAYARFLASGNHQPNDRLMALYVEDIGRYIGLEEGMR